MNAPAMGLWLLFPHRKYQTAKGHIEDKYLLDDGNRQAHTVKPASVVMLHEAIKVNTFDDIQKLFLNVPLFSGKRRFVPYENEAITPILNDREMEKENVSKEVDVAYEGSKMAAFLLSAREGEEAGLRMTTAIVASSAAAVLLGLIVTVVLWQQF